MREDITKENIKGLLGFLGWLIFAFLIAGIENLGLIGKIISIVVKTIVFGVCGIAIFITLGVVLFLAAKQIIKWLNNE